MKENSKVATTKGLFKYSDADSKLSYQLIIFAHNSGYLWYIAEWSNGKFKYLYPWTRDNIPPFYNIKLIELNITEFMNDKVIAIFNADQKLGFDLILNMWKKKYGEYEF